MLAVASATLSILICQNIESKDLPKHFENVRETDALSANLTSVCFNHSNQVVVTSSDSIELWQVSNLDPLTSIPFNNENIPGDLKKVKFSSNSRYVAAASLNEILVWDLKERNLKSRFLHNGIVNSIAFFLDSFIIGGDDTGDLRIWNLKAKTDAGVCVFSSLSRYPELDSPVSCVAVQSMRPNHVYCGRSDGTVQVFDQALLTLVRSMTIYPASGVTDLSLSPRNPKLLTAISAQERRISLIDVQAATPAPAAGTSHAPTAVHPAVSSVLLPPGGGEPTCVCCHENGFHIAVGTSAGRVLLYDWRDSKAPVCDHQVGTGTPVYGMAFAMTPQVR